MTKTTIDITPDKSLIQKLGLTGYRTEQAISELIDNAIDARINAKGRIDVTLDFTGKKVSVADDGAGMDVEMLKKALIIARGTKKEGKLGKFGLGMKSACSTIGKAFSITTTTADSNVECVVHYDEDMWLHDASKTWKNFEIVTRKKTRPWNGTLIEISKLNIALYPNQTSSFRRSFGIRYGAYLKDQLISLFINGRKCMATPIQMIKDSRKDIDIDLPDGNRLKGWIGLLEKRSIKGDYGIHLYKNKRLIRAFDKFGIRHHPEVAKIVGELYLDHIPVNFHKTGFIEDSMEYKIAVDAFQAEPIVVQTLRRSIAKTPPVSTIQSVLDYLPDEKTIGKIKSRLNSSSAHELLSQANEFVCSYDSKDIDFVFADGNDDELYDIAKTDHGYKIIINRKNPLFETVGNPLFLIGLIGLEAKYALPELERHGGFLEKRNIAWSKFIQKWSEKKKKIKKVKADPIVSPEYHLANDLVDLHDYLEEKFESDFQFTGLSTLSPYLHNAYNKITYNMETATGAGQLLHDVISNFTGEKFGVILNPNTDDTKAMMEYSERRKFIIIREFAREIPSTLASPEKAWIDLFVELKRNTVPISRDELENILDYLRDHKLIKEKNLFSKANHRNMLPEIQEYLGVIS